MSLIDIGASFIVADAVTQGLFNNGVWNFFTEGWFAPTTSAQNQYSLHEIVMGLTGADSGSSLYDSFGTQISQYQGGPATGSPITAFGDAIKTNLRNNGARMVGTAIIVPVVARVGKKLLAKPLINPINRVSKQLGITQATGVKL
tara:strand:- start:456 stop:890 length:435 start_codon:yes stop_codon:yes gene_type:complete